MTEQRFELKEREKAITVAEHLAHSLHCYSPKYDDADEYYHHNIVRWFILKDNFDFHYEILQLKMVPSKKATQIHHCPLKCETELFFENLI